MIKVNDSFLRVCGLADVKDHEEALSEVSRTMANHPELKSLVEKLCQDGVPFQDCKLKLSLVGGNSPTELGFGGRLIPSLYIREDDFDYGSRWQRRGRNTDHGYSILRWLTKRISK